jgi:hypothetical protein
VLVEQCLHGTMIGGVVGEITHTRMVYQ